MSDRYDNFQDKSFQYDYPIDFKCHPLDYMKGNQVTTYEMDYCDTACFPFQLHEHYWEQQIKINVFNFRYELLYSITTEATNSGKVYLTIDAETSKKIFKPGVYYCQVQAIKLKEILGPIDVVESCTTLLSPENCSILVK